MGEWRQVIKRVDREMAMDFLLHLLESYNINTDGTSWEYFRQFQQLHTVVTGSFMNRNDCKEVKKVRQTPHADFTRSSAATY